MQVGPGPTPRSTGGDLLDEEAVVAYRRRLGEIEGELDRGDAAGDEDGSRRLDEEKGALIEQLRSASGLGRRVRRSGDDVERARKAVTGRIRDALAKLRPLDADLADHLDEHVRTGRICRYR